MTSQPVAVEVEGCHRVAGSSHTVPPVIRIDDEGTTGAAAAAAILTPPPEVCGGGDLGSSTSGGERRRSVPAGCHGRYVDEPYIFSLSQAAETLVLTDRRRSEPFADVAAAGGESSPTATSSSPRRLVARSPVLPHRLVFVDHLASSVGKGAPGAESGKGGERRSSMGSPRLSLDADLLPFRAAAAGGRAAASPDVEAEQSTSGCSRSRFLSLPQSSADCLMLPTRRHSVAMATPTTARQLDVIDEESASTVVGADSRSLASSRRYSMSAYLTTSSA